MPDATDLGFELLPADDAQITAEEDLAAAVQSALAPDFPDVPGTTPEPLGGTWLFDFQTGRSVKLGASEIRVTGLEAVRIWCLMVLHSARYAHAIFDDAFGMEDPEGVVGETSVTEAIRTFQGYIEQALTQHDRVQAVDNFQNATWDPAAGVANIGSFDVILDDDSVVTIESLTLTAEEDE